MSGERPTGPAASGPGWTAIYRVALRTLPAELRRKHAPAMEALFARQLSRARKEGRLRAFAAGACGVWDVVRRAVYERSRTRGGGMAKGMAIEGWRQDLGHALRSLAGTPRFVGVVVLTLGLGVGANSALFSVVDAVLLEPLPFPNESRVVHLAWDGGTHTQAFLTSGKYQYWRDNARSLSAVATWWEVEGQLEGPDGVAPFSGLRVSHEFLSVLGYTPREGRGFTRAENAPGGARVAVVSYELWITWFGGATDVVGRALPLDGERYTVVGVLPPDFAMPHVEGPVDALVPLGFSADPMDEGQNWPTIALLREGTTVQEAESEVASLTDGFADTYPELVHERDRGMTIATFAELHVGGTAKALWTLTGVVTLVLLLACANVANLFLARATRRRADLALRAALGASRARIARLVLLEGVLVALAAASLGLVLARWGVTLLVSAAPAELPRMDEIGIDWRVVLFTYGVALAASALFGGVAAFPAVRARLSDVLKESADAASGQRARQLLVVTQTTIAVVLLTGAGLLVTTLVNLTRVDAGFDPDGLVAVRVPAKPEAYETSAAVWDLQQRVREALRSESAVRAVVGGTNLPLERGVNFPMTIAGRPDDFEGAVEWRAVTPGYFETLGIERVRGRSFLETDLAGGGPVAIVNEAFARRYFPDESPIGQRVEIGRFRGEFLAPQLAGPGAEIVGVVGDVREVSLRADPRRTVYVPQAQAPTRISNVLGTLPVFVVQRRAGGENLERVLVEALLSVDPGLPRPEVFPLGDVVTRSLARERFGAGLLAAFAALALILTGLGIYGVLAYSVRQRYREIGIRMALGAGRVTVRRMVLRQGIAPVLVGLVLGLAGSLGLSRVVAGYLWGVAPTDPVTLASVVATLFAVALAASWIPAREAVSLDPVRTLNAR